MLGLDVATVAGARGGRGGRAGRASCHSFEATTPVLMADGTAKPIGDVTVGDEVTSTDPETGETTTEPVVQLHDNHDADLADVTVSDDKGNTTVLHTTWHHPFWSDTDRRWVDAADLKPGTQLHSVNGDVEFVVGVHTWTGLQEMHDLTVAAIHTYYVIAGAAPVLVHNCGGYKPEHGGGYTMRRWGGSYECILLCCRRLLVRCSA